MIYLDFMKARARNLRDDVLMLVKNCACVGDRSGTEDLNANQLRADVGNETFYRYFDRS